MSELAELVRINRNIEKQNREIIRLLKIIAGEADFVDKSGYVIPEFEEPEEIYAEMDSFTSLLDVTCDVGEAYFIDGDIFKLTIQNNEVVIDNLMGDEETTNFNIAEIVSRESIERNQNIDDATVILTASSKGKLPQTLEMCYNQDAKKVFIPWDQAMELLGAPDTLQKVLKLNFYKSEDDLIEKMFGGE
jgi:predicted ATP-dependent Lon-type protease